MSSEPKYTPTNIPSKLKKTIYTHYAISGWSAGEIKSYDVNLTGENYILLATTEVVIKIPPQNDIKQKAVEALEAEKKKQMAEHNKKMQELQQKIDSLLCLEYSPINSSIDATMNKVPF